MELATQSTDQNQSNLEQSNLEQSNLDQSKPKRHYNVKISKLPHEELVFEHTLLNIGKLAPHLPPVVDLRNKMPPIFDQGQLGSCTANALCAVVDYDIQEFISSRLFVYYNERKMENDIPDDAGASLSDGIKTLQKYGVCTESAWPYDVAQFAVAPPAHCYSDSEVHKAIKVRNIPQNEISMKTSLALDRPFVVGIRIYDSFESATVASTGMVPFPNRRKEQDLGGHAIVCVGYDDVKKMWLMRNSWGTTWGIGGYFYLPYAYLLDNSLSSDLWSIIQMN